jgi:hypothetical protein
MVNEKVTGTPQTTRVGVSTLSYTEYYWVGYALALYLAEIGDPVQKVVSVIPPDEWLRLYPTHHEYGDELLLEKLSEIMKKQ